MRVYKRIKTRNGKTPRETTSILVRTIVRTRNVKWRPIGV